MKDNKTKAWRSQIYQAIKQSILKNELKPGQKLVISEFAESFGASQTPIREALGRLSAEGLIDHTPHKRLQVAPITQESIRRVYEVRPRWRGRRPCPWLQGRTFKKDCLHC